MHRICTGTNEDPCKMTCSKIPFLERSLPDKRANSNQHKMQGKHGRIWHEGTERTGKALGMGRCSSPLMTRKPKKTVRRKSACTRMGLEPTTHAVGACAPIQGSCSCRGGRCWHVGWRLLPCHQILRQLRWPRVQEISRWRRHLR